MIAEFSNGDPPVSLTPLKGGRWEGTWQSKRRQAAVTVLIKAASSDRRITGVKQVSDGFGADKEPPIISDNSSVDAASGIGFRPLSPGSLITIYGERLSDQNVTATAVPLGTSLGSTSVLMAGQRLPLMLASPSQITAIVPYGIEVNSRQQILVQRADTYSQPVSVNLAASSPAVFVNGGHKDLLSIRTAIW